MALPLTILSRAAHLRSHVRNQQIEGCHPFAQLTDCKIMRNIAECNLLSTIPAKVLNAKIKAWIHREDVQTKRSVYRLLILKIYQ